MSIKQTLWKLTGGVRSMGGSPPPPNYAPMQAASDYAANLSYKTANDQLAFQQQVYNDNKPLVAQAQQQMSANAAQQSAMTAQTMQQNADNIASYNTYGKPMEAQMASEAMNAGSQAQQDTAAGKAVADVNQQSANQQAQMNRSMTSMGVNPNSGKFAAMNNANSITSAAMAAGGATNARTNAYNQGMATRAGVAGYFSGKGNTALQGVQVATQAGAAGNAAASGASTASLSGASMMNSGFGAQFQAAGIGMQGAMNSANMANMSFNNQMSVRQANQADMSAGMQAAGMAF